MKIKWGVCILVCIMCGVLLAVDEPNSKQWTWLYRKIMTLQEQEEAHNKKVIVINKYDIPSCTQLVASWNAIRPTQGFFSFWIQARDAKTKQWCTWHHMIDWGTSVQQSYFSANDEIAQYFHVRLEAGTDNKFDSFRIKIAAHDGADLSWLKAVMVALTDYSKFKPEGVYDRHLQELSSVYIQGVPKISQFLLDHPDHSRLCSPTSCSMLMSFLREEPIDPIAFANNVFDRGLQSYGSWPFNVAHAFNMAGGTHWFFTARLNSFLELYKQLQRGLPVIVSVRGWLAGAPQSYDQGHLLIVIGWDAEKQAVICHDPAFRLTKKTAKRYPVASFLRAWERSYRLVYWAEPIHVV
jgi:hypothetical protein